MDRALRNQLRLAVTRCRQELERDFSRQLEGAYGVSTLGTIASEERLPNLDVTGMHRRRAIVAALEHARAGGMTPLDAREAFVRESAFSTLNRLTALKLLEAPERRLIAESLGKGTASGGFRQFTLLSPEATRGEPDGGYWLYLELLCEDLSAEIGVLFDLRLPQGILFPSEPALRAVLDELNDPALAPVWAEDETLGWVYQYFTPKELRDEARKASAAPRNAWELAFRNQFYTPRYVVDFLVDNTLGRLWYEMRQGDTALADSCAYLARRPHPIWLARGEQPQQPWGESVWTNHGIWTRPNPAAGDHIGDIWAYAFTAEAYGSSARFRDFEAVAALANAKLEEYERTGRWSGTFEELRICLFFEQRRWRHFGDAPEGDALVGIQKLFRAICEAWEREVESIPYRRRRDPRTLRILDPACGSGHFLLGCFDLLLTIYAEAWDDPELGAEIRREYPQREAWQRATPLLILRHNLHGIDIDLRAVQIAQLALWLRAQRAWAAAGLRPSERPPIERVDIVAAEPLPGERDLLGEFVRELHPVLGGLVEEVWQGMDGVGEIGSLLQADRLLRDAIAHARRDWQSGEVFDQLRFFESSEPVQTRLELRDTAFITDESFWDALEGELLAALARYAAAAGGTSAAGYRRRLFAGDAAQGLVLLELFVAPFDVVLMNPPFGAVSRGAKAYVERHYPRTKNDLYAAFVERGLQVLAPGGLLGAITSRTGFFLTSFQKWREEILLDEARVSVFADLGYGVLDTAMVETAAYVVERRRGGA